MISYEGLEKALKKKGIGKTELSKKLGLSTRTIAKIAKGEKLSQRSVQKIADYLGESPNKKKSSCPAVSIMNFRSG